MAIATPFAHAERSVRKVASPSGDRWTVQFRRETPWHTRVLASQGAVPLLKALVSRGPWVVHVYAGNAANRHLYGPCVHEELLRTRAAAAARAGQLIVGLSWNSQWLESLAQAKEG